MNYELIQVRTEAGKVGIVTLNRPKQLNALNDQLMDELGAALRLAFARREPTLIEVPVGPMPSPWEFIHMPRVRGK